MLKNNLKHTQERATRNSKNEAEFVNPTALKAAFNKVNANEIRSIVGIWAGLKVAGYSREAIERVAREKVAQHRCDEELDDFMKIVIGQVYRTEES